MLCLDQHKKPRNNETNSKVKRPAASTSFLIPRICGSVINREYYLQPREPSTRQVRVRGALGIHRKLLVAFRGPYIRRPQNQAMHKCQQVRVVWFLLPEMQNYVCCGRNTQHMSYKKPKQTSKHNFFVFFISISVTLYTSKHNHEQTITFKKYEFYVNYYLNYFWPHNYQYVIVQQNA